ncbi:MAG: leucine-rich repeat domain-containing protein [Bacteroidales bacterium]|nr:leucine-rich repeat domain-containing protein [Bacteroidales bacterium]
MKYKDIIINMKKQVTLIAMFLYSVLAWGQTIVGSGDGWSLDSEGVLTITKNFESVSYTGQPWSSYKSSIKSVVITEDVTSIGQYEFYGHSNLKNVTFSNTVTSIGKGSFYGCSSIENITLPSSLTSIGYQSFYNCSGLTSIDIPNSVTSIGTHAFQGCSGLTSIRLPNSIKTIGSNLLSGCKKLTNIVIPEGVTTIGLGAFYSCSNLTSVTIPSSVKTFDKSIFSGCSKLENVIIPDGVTSISESMFNGCSGLKSITLPSTITSIGEKAFLGCSSLVGTIEIPNGVKSLGNDTFSGCSSLSEIILPNSITTIGNNVFRDCASITSFVIPNSLTEMGTYVFDGCSGIELITIPSNVEKISVYDFATCSNLKYVFLFQESVIEKLTSIFPTNVKRFFVHEYLLDGSEGYREKYTGTVFADKFTGFSFITKQNVAGDEEEVIALSLEKGSYGFIVWAVNSGEKIREGEEISIALTEDFDLDADNVTWQTLGTAEHPFKGIFDGQGHSIIFGGDAANSDNTLFGHIDEGAEIKNLNVENMNVMAGDDNKVVDGEYTYYPILAKENRGTIKKCVVSGSVMCDEEIENDEKSIGCFIVDNYGTLDHVVEFYKYGIEAEGNKRNIVIMQNMGVGRNAGQTRKVCNNRKKNKSLSATPSSDVNNDCREYTDEEMASGEPAYWLNYAGKGYTGDYTSEWSKGKMHPIMATELSKPAVKIVYDINGATESEAGLINPLFFANEDDEIEIETAVAPEKVWVGNNVAEELNSKTKLTKKLLSSAAKDGIITVHLMYSKATGIENAKAEKSIRVNGHAISIDGAEGESYSVVDVMGRTVAEGECSKELKTIVVPASGIYIVKAGETFKKIIVR